MTNEEHAKHLAEYEADIKTIELTINSVQIDVNDTVHELKQADETVADAKAAYWTWMDNAHSRVDKEPWEEALRHSLYGVWQAVETMRGSVKSRHDTADMKLRSLKNQLKGNLETLEWARTNTDAFGS